MNLCTDELLLLLARPDQIATITQLSQQPEESVLWREARRHAANDGSLLGVVRHRPDMVLAMGGRGGDRLRIARRLGIRVVDLPFPNTIADVVAAIRKVALELGRVEAGEVLVKRIFALQRSVPASQIDTIWLSGGGRSTSPDSLTAQWMRLAGFRQRELTGDRVTLELLLTRPPASMVRSEYRKGQYSMEQRWLNHPRVKEAPSHVYPTDGRTWLCHGPTLVDEILRLRREIAR